MNTVVKTSAFLAAVCFGFLSVNASANTTKNALPNSPMSATAGINSQSFAYHEGRYRHQNRRGCFWTRSSFKYHFKPGYDIVYCKRTWVHGHRDKVCKVCYRYRDRYYRDGDRDRY